MKRVRVLFPLRVAGCVVWPLLWCGFFLAGILFSIYEDFSQWCGAAFELSTDLSFYRWLDDDEETAAEDAIQPQQKGSKENGTESC